MAERRMFAKTITESDAFLDMPLSTQALYFHLGMLADDDGFVNSPKKIVRMIGCAEDDLKLLIAKRFILTFEDGIIVIKHWKINNYIAKDRYKETIYKDLKALIQVKDDGSYTECIQDVYKLDTQDRLGKDSIDKVNNKERNNKERKFTPPSLDEIQKYINEKNLSVDAKQFYDYFETGNWIDAKGNKVKNWKQKILTWNKFNQGFKNNTKKEYETISEDLSNLYDN